MPDEQHCKPVRIALLGAGLMGRQHLGAIAASGEATLAGLIDPSPDAAAIADEHGVRWLADPSAAGQLDADAAIIATPNQLHLAHARACLAAGWPVLVEKPLADTPEAAAAIRAAGEQAGLPVLVGYHRRHSAWTAAARAAIANGELGEIVAVQGSCWLYKPDDYFDAAWRREPGGGPININLVHDLDLLQHLIGPVESVCAMASHARRGFPVEDTAAVLLRFAGGALGTLSLSDTAVSPWSWELTAAENPAYHPTGQSAYRIAGTTGALDLPNPQRWHHPGTRGWWQPMQAEPLPVERDDPLVRQIRHFAAVVRGIEAPLVNADDGIQAMRVIEALRRSLASGQVESIVP